MFYVSYKALSESISSAVARKTAPFSLKTYVVWLYNSTSLCYEADLPAQISLETADNFIILIQILKVWL
ncbi:hypothetical protein DXT99_03585 [Pontibacter diazotrophicus]|uniref:Uncharacterized protein n=1 Tax=Pontibacter diazotrophicus TaxID=1400979 RepID=A0A3D8LHB5_9BACT|nr:hypothetical protein DXT99_03585 [Pontibacter diazotrophicus]